MPKIPVGDHIYLHRPDAPSDVSDERQLVISCHGMAIPARFTVPGHAQLYFYEGHGDTLTDPGVSELLVGKYQPVETVGSGSVCPDYLLSKFQGRHGSATETYRSIQGDVNANSTFLNDYHSTMANGSDALKKGYKARLDSQGYAYHFDVLTIRNRWSAKLGIRFSTVLESLGNAGYRYGGIHCSFCRWVPFKGRQVSAKGWGT